MREHRALGHRTLLITGALDFVIEPIRPLFDDIVCASMSRKADGSYTGELTDVPPTGESRAQALYDYCDANGFDPAGVRRLRRLVLGPAAARRRRLPGGGQPGDEAGGHRPQPGLAGRALGQGVGSVPRLPIAPQRPTSLRRLGSVIR